MYLAAWVVFWNMASPSSLSAMPLHPRKIWKLNKAIFGVIFSNLALLPVGISLIKYRYFTMRGSTKSSGLLTDIPYTSAKSSNKLDIYIPDSTVRVMDSRSFRLNSSSNEQLKLRPVVVFIYGGGWATGTKWMYTLVGARLREMGYVVFLPEYSVYPATIQNMEYEVRSAIQWTHSHCSEFGGDPNRMYLMGHSAGAHLCVLSVLNDCIKRTPVSLLGGPAVVSNSPVLSSLLKETNTVGTLPRLRGMMLYSGVYDIGEHYKHESMRGVEELSVMARLMGGTETSFRLWSPKYVLKELIQVTSMIDSTHPNESQATRLDFLQHLKSLLPLETLIIHGDKDATVPLKSSVELFEETKALNLGGSVRFQMLAGMGHEEPVVDELDDGYDEDDYTEDNPMTSDEQAQMANAVEDVSAMLGGAKIPIKEIEDAVWYYYFDVNKAASFLIDQLAAAEQKKQRTAAAAAKKSTTTKSAQSGASTPISTPKLPAKAKADSPKLHDDDIVEFLDDDDVPDNQLRFDMSAMNFGSSLKSKAATTPKSTTKSSVQTPLLASEISSMTTPAGSAPPSGVSTPRTSTKIGKKIDVVTEYQRRVAEKESLNLVVIGHVDAGKSTLMGHLLYLQGEVNEKTIRKHERDAQKIGKASFAFAWVLDETGEERARGITMDVGVTKFETEHRRFTLLDAPGHRDFIPNMISGTAQADVAILVVDATTGEFESGFDANGQTKEHALLARSLGVQQLVVAVNKLDVVNWSEARFQEIVRKLEVFLVKDASFKKSNLIFIPCSGFTGENLVQRSKAGNICNGSAVSDAPVDDAVSKVLRDFEWYRGPTLIQTIDKLDAPTRAVEKPFRMSVTD
ncbi:HBS1-like protein, partial [Podila humilis]